MRLLLVLLLSSALAFAQSPSSPYDSVNPFIGTGADGNTFPGATLPFGMMQWGPDTAADGWYRYAEKAIRGFSLTHISGAGCPIYADVPILPWTGEVKDPGWNHSYALAFSHDHEQAHPGYYSVGFDNDISTAITTAMRAGIARFGFPAGASRTVLFKAGSSATAENPKRKDDTSEVEIRGNKTVVGTVHSGGFCDSNSDYTLSLQDRGRNSPQRRLLRQQLRLHTVLCSGICRTVRELRNMATRCRYSEPAHGFWPPRRGLCDVPCRIETTAAEDRHLVRERR